TGEGHLSSIEFRSGTVDAAGDVTLDTPTGYSQLPEHIDEKHYNQGFLHERMPHMPDLRKELVAQLPERFTFREAVQTLRGQPDMWPLLDLLESNYDVTFLGGDLSERVIFPHSKREQVGMEDVRFVRFQQEDGSHTYYGTYTAYNGREINVQVIQTDDFLRFSVHTLHGAAVRDKGMALFPRKVGGQYVMTSRQDGKNLYLMRSADFFVWEEAELLRMPQHPWEFTQMGNCGSPIETEAGWLLLTHAVGPVRRYVLSACLLDLDDPSKVLGALSKPLMEPTDQEREGYVPNVLYTCGWLRHGEHIVIPYAMSDSYTGFARVGVRELVDELLQPHNRPTEAQPAMSRSMS
ncbi:MAG: glycosidase, partial [Catalinimonas sp.]